MPNVQDYLEAQKKAHNSSETMQRRMRQAYDAAQESLQQGNYDNLESLVDDNVRNNFKQEMITKLLDPLRASIAALPEDDIFAEDMLMRSFYGVTQTNISEFVDAAREQNTFSNFMKWLQSDKTEYVKSIKERLNTPRSIMGDVTAADVSSYVNVTFVTPDLVTLDDKIELVDIFEQSGVVPPKYLQNKPYM